MPLLRLDQACLNYGPQILLDNVDLALFKGNKVGLLGRNGEGKTTLLKVVAQLKQLDSGDYWLRPGVKVAWLEQNLPDADQQTVYQVVAGGLEDVGDLLTRYHELIQQSAPDMEQLEKVQQELEAKDGWQLQQKVETILSQLQLSADQWMKDLSGGWRRRAALARALVQEPDIFLLDEPTNHLDIPAIEWLEKQLQNYSGALFFVTHDRAFLQKVANQIAELDRGQLSLWEGDYRSFLRFREQQLAAEEQANALFDKKLAQEEVWIRQGIKARRTRNEGRVRALQAMREERQQRRTVKGRAKFQMEEAESSGKAVIRAKGVHLSYGGQSIIKDFSTRVMRGDRIGIIGANGTGKSTLLRLLLKQLEPDQGTVKLGTKLEMAYFDQLREQLDLEKNLIDNVCEGRDFIEINGKSRHAISYLGDFLFSPQRVRMPAKALSGGEQNRAILAKLFSKPANLLVLDEPTNDLDIETLELLEEILLDFKGTLLLVSHDRQFMDNVVTGVMVLEGNGAVGEYVGGYSDWIAKGGELIDAQDALFAQQSLQASPKPVKDVVSKEKSKVEAAKPKKKLSYKDQRELDQLPELIEQLESQQVELEQRISDPEFYALDHDEQAPVLKDMTELQKNLQEAYQRWEILDQ